MRTIDWDPSEGDALQGDVILFQVPDDFVIDKTNEIKPKNNNLVLAEGEVTGHHHQIALFREDGSGAGLGTIARPRAETKSLIASGTAKLYEDRNAVRKLVEKGELTTDRLAIGFLIVEGGPVVLRHDEHDSVRIPPGKFYVGGQEEWDAATARRVKD
jgi:hypothetical protein